MCAVPVLVVRLFAFLFAAAHSQTQGLPREKKSVVFSQFAKTEMSGLIPAMKYFAADQESYDVYFVTPVGSLVLRETTPTEQKAKAEEPHQESQSQKSQSFLLYYVEDHPERYGLVGHTQQEQEEAGVIPGVAPQQEQERQEGAAKADRADRSSLSPSALKDLEGDATPVWGIGVNPLLRMKKGPPENSSDRDPDKLWMDFAPPASQLQDLKNAGVTIVPFRACDMFAYWGIFFEFVALPEGVSSFFDRGQLLDTASSSATNPIKAACYEYGERWYRWFAEKLVKRASLFVADAFHAWNPAHPLQGIASADHLPALVLYAGNVKDGLRHLKEYKGSAGGWWRKDEFGIAYRILRSPRLVNHFLPVVAVNSTCGEGKQVGLGGESACGGVQLPDVGCRQENLGHGGGGMVSRGNEQRVLFDWPAADAEQIQAGREHGESAKIASALAKRVTVRDPVSQKIIAAPFAIVADQASSINLRMQDGKDYTDHDHPIIREMEDMMKPDSGFDAVVYVSFGTQSYIEFTGRGQQYLFGEFSRLKRAFFFIVLPNSRDRGATRTKSSPQESSFAFDVEESWPQENVRVVSSYAPQRELFRRLGTGSGNRTTKNDKIADHKRKRFLFISHGGSGSLSEAAAHGVPTLCMPFLNDQWDNCAQLAAANLGKSLAHLSVALIMASYEQSDASVKGAAAAGAETYVSLLGIASPDAFHPAVAGQVRALWEHSLGFADESLGTSQTQGVPLGDLSLTMDSAEGVLAAAIGEFLFADENYEAVLESLRRNAAAMVTATLDRNTEVGPLLEHFLERAAEASRRKKEKEAVRDQIMSLGMLTSDSDDPDEL